MTSTKPLKIFIDTTSIPLTLDQTKYVFKLLLKTAGFPYYFIRTIKNADIIYSDNQKSNSKLFIRADKKLKIALSRDYKKRIVEEENIPFIIIDGLSSQSKNLLQKKRKTISIKNDIIFTIYYIIMGFQENYIPRDRHGIHNVRHSFLFKKGYLYKPLVNIYVNFIRFLFAKTHKPIDIWPNKKKFALVLTHDCDYIEMKRYIELIRYIFMHKLCVNPIKLIEIMFSQRQTFWNFDDWMKIEQKYGLKSTFFFCAIKGSLLKYYFTSPDPFYNIKKTKYRKLFNKLKNKNFEIGLHSSYQAYSSKKRFREERLKLMRFSKSEVLGNRHHYWHTSDNFIETVKIHQKVGFLYDTSLAFDHHSGFRRSICTPLKFFDIKTTKELDILEMPTALMDGQLFNLLKYNYLQKKESVIDALIDSVKKYNGMLIVDYHTRVLNKDFFPGWKKSYIYLLDKATRGKDYYSDTILNIAKYWLNREKIIEGLSKDEACGAN